ncbi:MAG TPA: carboxypeptidase-like regulatory domain-containing protein [Terriglobia bacterium]|jgi:hypothetical protein
MKRVLATTLYLLLVSTFGYSAAAPQAQGTATINGTVKDPSGAVLPGVEVTATQTSTNVSRQVVSDERGNFVLPNLPVGPYKVEAALPGFRTFVQTGIELGVNQNPNLNVTMAVGQVSQEVEVNANVTLVETQNLGVRQVIENQEILELPLQSRNPTDLLGLSGGVVPDTAGNASTRSLQGGVGLSIQGLAEGSTTFTLDGALHTNPFDNLNFPIPFPDALQEFSIQTGAQNASGGFQGGATVASVTKSGTNQFHGDVFDYYRNDKFGARGYTSTTKGSQRRQQIGGTIGGPILKDKLFFFGAYQYTTSTSNPTNSAVTLPTPAMLNGDFSQFLKVYTDSKNQIGGCQSVPINNFAGGTPGQLRLTDSPNFIDPKRFDPAAVKLIHLLPQVNGMQDDVFGATHAPLSLWADNPMQTGHSGTVGNDPCGRVWHTSYNSAHDSQIIGKIDYQKSAKNTITGRFFLTPQLTAVPNTLETSHLGFQDTANLGSNGQDNTGAFFTIGDTYVISPTMINSLNLAANRTFIHREGPFAYDVNDLGINAFTYLKKTFEFAVNSSGGGVGAASGQGGVQTDATNSTNTANISDNISITHGRHQISFGGSIATWKVISYANVRSIPVFSFSPSQTTLDSTSTGLGWADFLLGHWTTLRESAPNGLLMKQWYMGYHVQDQWKATNRLTVNAGVRWEPFFPQQQLDGHIYNFSYQAMLAGQKSQVFSTAPPGFSYPGDPGFPNAQAGLNHNWKTFGPRIGMGFDPKGDGKTAIRASYAISYDFVNGQWNFNTNIAPPFGDDTGTSFGPQSSAATLSNPWAGFHGAGFAPNVSPFPYNNSLSNKSIPFTPFGPFISTPPDLTTTYVQTYSLSVQRQLPANFFVSVQYTGNGTRHGWGTYPLNPGLYVPGTGVSTGGCMVPNGAGGTQSLLVADGQVATLAAARASASPCSSATSLNYRRILSMTNAAVGQYASSLDTFEAGENAQYNGLVLSVRRQAKDLTLNANYTWSHCINDLTGNPALTGMPNVDTGDTYTSINGHDPGTPSTAFFDNNGNWLPGVTGLAAAPVHQHDWNRVNCGTDFRQRFTTTAIAQVPRFSNTLVRGALTGWSVSSIVRANTGSYLTIASGGDTALIGGSTAGQTAIQKLADPYSPGRPTGPRAQYLAPGAFVAASTGALSSNHGKFNIVGPGFWQWDAALSRNFQIKEGQRIQARVDMYNVTNSFRPGNPSTSLTSNYGLITSAVGAAPGSVLNRDVQFALKYFF